MTSERSASPSGPSLECMVYESLLPVLDEPALDAVAVARARQHVVGCPYCRGQVDDYAHIEAALRRHLRDLTRHPTEELMSQIETEHAADEAVAHAGATLPALPPWRRGPRWTRISAVASVAAVLVVAVLLAGVLGQHHVMTVGTPTTQTTQNDPFANTILQDLAMVSPTEGWAVGESEHPATGGGVTYTAMVMHLRNGSWNRVDLPYQSRLTSISMLSPTEGWASGDKVLLHFDGHHWTPSLLPEGGSFAIHVQEVSPTTVWAVGGSGAGVLHFDGRGWDYQPLPPDLQSLNANQNVSLTQLLMISATEGWAVGTIWEVTPGRTDSSGSPLVSPTAVILHFRAGAWQLDSRIPNTSLQSLSQAPDGTVLAAGNAVIELHPAWTTTGTTYPTDRPVVLARTNGTWQRDDTPIQRTGADPASIQTADFISSRDPWLIAGMDSQTNEPRLLHLAAGGWSLVTLPAIPGARETLLNQVVTVSSGEIWAIGDTIRCHSPLASDPCTSHTLILHQVNGTWSVIVS